MGPEHLLPGTTGSEVVRELSGLDVVAVVPILGEAPLLQKVTLPDINYIKHKKVLFILNNFVGTHILFKRSNHLIKFP